MHIIYKVHDLPTGIQKYKITKTQTVRVLCKSNPTTIVDWLSVWLDFMSYGHITIDTDL